MKQGHSCRVLSCLIVTIAVCPAVGEDLDRSILPIPELVFSGRIGLTPADSEKDFPRQVEPPEGTPNIVVIITDDVGFAVTDLFGGSIPTSAFKRIAETGLRYNRFHTTARCSPTRAALLTGRNHHTAGTGSIMEAGVGYALGNWQNDEWKLDNLEEDFSESNNLADDMSGKLEEMKQLFQQAAKEHEVLPLDDRGAGRIAKPKPPVPGSDENPKTYTYAAGATRISETAAPQPSLCLSMARKSRREKSRRQWATASDSTQSGSVKIPVNRCLSTTSHR